MDIQVIEVEAGGNAGQACQSVEGTIVEVDGDGATMEEVESLIKKLENNKVRDIYRIKKAGEKCKVFLRYKKSRFSEKDFCAEVNFQYKVVCQLRKPGQTNAATIAVIVIAVIVVVIVGGCALYFKLASKDKKVS